MSAAKDPVAEKSTFLCMYMSNHPDTLVAYVKYFGKVKERVASAKMTSIDTNGMNLSYKVSSTDAQKEVRVTFEPPLSGYEEVKPRLLGMTADAQESLGMTKVPQISTFQFPRRIYQTGIPIAFLFYTLFSPLYSGPAWTLGQFLYYGIGGATVKWITIIAGLVHFLEAAYVARLCSKHQTGLYVGAQYVIATFTFGYTVLVPLRRRIQKARIDSIMKGN